MRRSIPLFLSWIFLTPFCPTQQEPVPPRRKARQHPRLQVGLQLGQALRLWVRPHAGGHRHQEERASPLLPLGAGRQARKRVLSGWFYCGIILD